MVSLYFGFALRNGSSEHWSVVVVETCCAVLLRVKVVAHRMLLHLTILEI